jgi:Ni,Fe-hydrogenase III large subunit/Ni,Fe-hydrogenase III component G
MKPLPLAPGAAPTAEGAPSPGPLVREVDAADLATQVTATLSRGGRLLISTASDARREEGCFRWDHAFWFPGRPEVEVLRARLEGDRPACPSLVPVLPAVHWDEREAMDLLGIAPLGHPDPRRLVLPDDWPAGLHPLRADVAPDVHPPAAPPGWAPRLAEGEGVVFMPVGPVHAGIIESGHFAFSLMGETILDLDLRLFQKHRGVEKALEGRPWDAVGPQVARICSACSASHQAAWSEAVEEILAWELPHRAVRLRTALLECERLYNHLNDIAAIPAGTGFAVAAMEGAGLKERMLRLQEAAFGHRYLFDTIVPGGVARDLPAEDALALRRGIAELRGRLGRLSQRLLRHPGFLDRLQGTGMLPRAVADRLGAVGPAARASGVPYDLRLDRPYLSYRALAPLRVTEANGDVGARLRVRLREAEVSCALLDRLLYELPAGPHRAVPPAGAASATGLGIGCNESPRGVQAHALELRAGRVWRHHIRSSSFANWPMLLAAVPGNLIGDFPLINKSFELCYACCDR